MSSRKRTIAGAGLGVSAVIVVAALVGGAVRAIVLDGEMVAAQGGLERAAQRAERAGLDLSTADAAAIAGDLAAADARLATLEAALAGDPVVAVARLVPGAGGQIDAAATLIRSVRLLTSRSPAIERLLLGYVQARDADTGLARAAVLARFAAAAQPEVADVAAAVRAANEMVRSVPGEGLVAPLEAVRSMALNRLAALRPAADAAESAAEVVPSLLGVGGSRRYLVLALDNAEIRPMGGLIAAFATPRFVDGVLGDYGFRDILDIDRPQQPVYVEPPPGLKDHLLGRFSWQVADAGWWPDLAANVAEVRRLYRIETGADDFQGVIAFTPDLVDRLLAIVGPVDVPVAGVTVRAGETYLISLEQVEVLHRGEGRKAFLAQLAAEVLRRVVALSPGKLMEVWRALDEAGTRREFQVLLDDTGEQSRVRALGWSRPFSFPDRADRLAVMDANVAPVSKLNVLTTVSHRLDVTLGEDGSATETLRTTYNNRFGPELDPALQRVMSAFASGNLGSYQRRYLSPNAILLDVRSDTQPPLSAPERVASEQGCLVVASYVLVRPGQTTLETRYRVPDVVLTSAGSEVGAGSYTLAFHMQPGRDGDGLTVTVRTPPGTRPVTWSEGGVLDHGTVSFSTTTEFDRMFVVGYAQG